MNCPACGRPLSTQVAGPITVDTCSGGCGGIWFDHFELKKVDEQTEAAGESLLEVPRDSSLKVDTSKRRSCPKCGPEIVMARHYSSVKRQVTIDECPKCGGIWLDPGELADIRSEFANEAKRHSAAEETFEKQFDPVLNEMRQEDEAELAKAQHFAHVLRFICPSYYEKGKQDWGAF